MFLLFIGQPLNISDIRLAGGTRNFDGRVEVFSNGVWGTICDRYIDLEELQTTCKMLNLKYSSFVSLSTFSSKIQCFLVMKLYTFKLRICFYLLQYMYVLAMSNLYKEWNTA